MAGSACAQSAKELIPNGSFETFRTCPRQDNLLEEAVPWYNPNQATPDFYNECYPTDQIELPPRTGRGLARLFLDRGWGEYLATPLKKPLEADKCYYFEYYITTRNPNQYIIGTMGAYFSVQPLTSNRKDLLPANPQVMDPPQKTISASFKWERIAGTFKAKGGEQFVTIGSFNRLPEFLAFYYVFIDDVSLVPVELNLGNDTTLCGRKSTLLLKATTPGATEYRWNDGSKSPTFLVNRAGTYWVEVTTPCKILRDTIIVSYALPFTLGADTTLCNAQSLTLRTPDNAVDFTWQDGSRQRTQVVSRNGTYSLRVTQGGCVVADTIRIAFIKPPQLILGPNKALCGSDVYVIKPAYAEGTFAWRDAFARPQRTVSRSGVYRASVSNACATIRDSVTIDYGECGCLIYAPDIFTPNADGHNDTFEPFACGDISFQSLTIFNRWGEAIFSTQTAPFLWNGQFKGTSCPAGVYAWRIDYLFFAGETTTQKQKEGRLVVSY